LSRAAAALAGDDVTVLLVSIDRGGAAKAMPFLDRHGVTGVRLGFDPKARLSREMQGSRPADNHSFCPPDRPRPGGLWVPLNGMMTRC
jgi:hypothetical protein